MAIDTVESLILQINEIKKIYEDAQNDFVITNAQGKAKARYYLHVHNILAKAKRNYHRVRKESVAVFKNATKSQQDEVIKAADEMDTAAKGMTDMLLRMWGLKKEDPRVAGIMANAEKEDQGVEGTLI
jgi:precorrin-3B methylase